MIKPRAQRKENHNHNNNKNSNGSEKNVRSRKEYVDIYYYYYIYLSQIRRNSFCLPSPARFVSKRFYTAIRNYKGKKNVLAKSVSCLHGINKQWNHRLHEGFNAKWYARLDTYGLEICPKQYVRIEYEIILKGKLIPRPNLQFSIPLR